MRLVKIHRRLVCSITLLLIVLGTSIEPSKAETKFFSLTLNSDNNQSSKTLFQQAESLTLAAINQEFAANPNTTDISVAIVEEQDGQTVPLLLTNVSRIQWQQDPRLQRWTKYLSNSPILLSANTVRSLPTSSQSLQSFSVKSRFENDPAFRND